MPDSKPTSHRPFVIAAVCLGAAWIFHRQWVLPVQEREKETQSKIAEVRGQIESASKELETLQLLRNRASAGVAELGELRADGRDGAVMAWFPTRVQQAFSQSKAPVSSVRLNTTLLAPGLPGCERSYWQIVAPYEPARRGVAGLLSAINDIERQDPFVRLVDFSVKSDPSGSTNGLAEMNFVVLTEQQRAGDASAR